MTLGARAIVMAELQNAHESRGYGPGFWMLVVGGGLLTLSWIGVIQLDRRLDADRAFDAGVESVEWTDLVGVDDGTEDETIPG
jgi:hypothetical protein